MAVLAVPVAAQQGDAPFGGETTVNVVEVPVLVVDPATGEPVRGLSPDAFIVTENGRRQDISNFFEVTRGDPRDVAGAAAADNPTVAAGPDVKPVEIVYFFDLFLMETRDRDRAVAGLVDMYRSSVPRGERVSVVVFDGELETLVDRTDDRDDVLDALEELGYIRARGIQQASSFTQALADSPVTGDRDTDFYERRNRSREYMADLERMVRRVGDAMQAAMARFGRADARKVMVAFTPGQPNVPWAPRYAAVDIVNNTAIYPQQGMWREVAHEAADLGFTVYAVDTSGVRVSPRGDVDVGPADTFESIPLEGEIDPSGGGGPAQAAGAVPVDPDALATDAAAGTLDLFSWLERSRKTMIIDTAESTGGEAFFVDDVRTAATAVQRATDHWYSLAFVADHVGDGETYTLDVELPGHPEYVVSHRTSYVDRPAGERAAQRLRSEMLFGGDANPLGIRVEIGTPDERFRLGAAGSKRVEIPVELKIPFGRLEMIRRGDLYWGQLLISFFAEDEAGNQSQLASQEQQVSVDAARYDEAVAKGYFSYRTTLQIEGGTQKVYIGVEDLLSARTSIMPQTFEY
jgi:VWFA-related protein